MHFLIHKVKLKVPSHNMYWWSNIAKNLTNNVQTQSKNKTLFTCYVMGRMFENFPDVLYSIWLAGSGDSRESLLSWQATSRQTAAQVWIFNWSTSKAGSKVGSKQNEFSQTFIIKVSGHPLEIARWPLNEVDCLKEVIKIKHIMGQNIEQQNKSTVSVQSTFTVHHNCNAKYI